jgi:hypothetical protein
MSKKTKEQAACCPFNDAHKISPSSAMPHRKGCKDRRGRWAQWCSQKSIAHWEVYNEDIPYDDLMANLKLA